jgi:D-arabinose 1-dehydrogenase-like Zn-dependent alcohol dehydrogenase
MPLLLSLPQVYAPLAKYAPPTKSVGVVGLGGLGSMAVQFAAARGNAVTAISTSTGKKQLAEKLGATSFLCSTDAAAMAAAAESIDVLLLTLTSGDFELAPYLPLMRRNGVIVVVGALGKPLVVPAFVPLVVKQLTVTGSLTGGRGQIAEMLDFAARKRIRPLVEVFPFESINDALQKVLANEVRFRAVLAWGAAPQRAGV